MKVDDLRQALNEFVIPALRTAEEKKPQPNDRLAGIQRIVAEFLGENDAFDLKDRTFLDKLRSLSSPNAVKTALKVDHLERFRELIERAIGSKTATEREQSAPSLQRPAVPAVPPPPAGESGEAGEARAAGHPPPPSPPRRSIAFAALIIGGVLALAAIVHGYSNNRTPRADPQCEAPNRLVPYRDAQRICVTAAMSDFLACLEMAQLDEVESDVKKSMHDVLSGGALDAQATASVEAESLQTVKLKYAAGPKAIAINACAAAYQKAAGLQPAMPDSHISVSADAASSAAASDSSAREGGGVSSPVQVLPDHHAKPVDPCAAQRSAYDAMNVGDTCTAPCNSLAHPQGGLDQCVQCQRLKRELKACEDAHGTSN